jgi:hypothetical protein
VCVRVLRVSGFLRVHGNNFVIPCYGSYYGKGCGRRCNEVIGGELKTICNPVLCFIE